MPDPLSLVLAVITLATAAKDIIEVFDKLKDAFSELPEGYAQAKLLMLDIHKTINAMNEAYSEQMEDRRGASALRKSLDSLQNDMLLVYQKLSDLIKPLQEDNKNKIALAFSSLRKGKKVKALVEGLKERVDKSSALFMTLSTIQIRLAVDDMGRNFQKLVEKNALHLNMAKRDFEDFHSSLVSHTRLIQFTASSSPPMSWIPGSIPVQDISKAFLHRELDILDKSVQALSTRWFENSPATLEIPPVKSSWNLQVEPISSTAIHREALQLTYQIRDMTESPPPLWAHIMGNKLSHLSVHLDNLQMHDEAISVHNLRIDIWTAMTAVYPGKNTSAHLVEALMNLSIDLSNTRDRDRSHRISNQALTMIKSTPEISDLKDTEPFLAQILSTESRNIAEPSTALDLAQASVRHIEGVLDIRNLQSIIPTEGQTKEDEFSSVVSKIAARNVSHDLLFTYAAMVVRLAETQLNNNLFMQSSASAKRALVVLHQLSKVYPGSSRIFHLISGVLVHLADPQLSSFNTVTEKWQFAQENVNILTKLGEIDPQRYVLSLLSALYTKRECLLTAGKERKAWEVYKQMTELGTMAVDAYSDIKIPSETEGDYYFQLADYHFSCQRFQESLNAAKNAIAQYAALEDMTPGRQSPGKHFRAVVFLCRNHFILKQYDACTTEGFKALQLLDNLSVRLDHIALVDVHMELLDKMMEALREMSNLKALEWARDINFRIQRLFDFAASSSRKIRFQNAQAPHKYVSILKDNNCVDEAARYANNIYNRWEEMYGEHTNVLPMVRISYVQFVMGLPSLFKAKGETDDALRYSQQAMDVAEEFFKQGFLILKLAIYIDLSSAHIDLLSDTGRYAEALELSELVLTYAREAEATGNISTTVLVQVLAECARCQLYALKPHDAITTASEGVFLGQRALKALEGPGDTTTNRQSMLYTTFLNLADGYADSGNVDEALRHLSNAKDALSKRELANAEEVGSDVHSYQVISIKKARLMFAKGEYAIAASLMEDVVDIERERSKARKSLVSSLIKALQFSGIVYCILGRHEDGIRAASEVLQLKESLAISSGLARLVKVEEVLMTSRGLWDSVRSARDKLKCHHQELTMGFRNIEIALAT